MNKNTKTLLGVAVVAGLGYFLYTKYGKKSTAGFANAAGLGFQIIPQCQGDRGTVMLNGKKYFNCCKMGYFGETSAGGPCGSGSMGKQQVISQ